MVAGTECLPWILKLPFPTLFLVIYALSSLHHHRFFFVIFLLIFLPLVPSIGRPSSFEITTGEGKLLWSKLGGEFIHVEEKWPSSWEFFFLFFFLFLPLRYHSKRPRIPPCTRLDWNAQEGGVLVGLVFFFFPMEFILGARGIIFMKFSLRKPPMLWCM